MSLRTGRLFGLGVGPGDPELVTVKALRLLRTAAVVAYPAPEQGPSFARSIVAQWLDGSRTEIAIRFPMRPGPPPAAIYDNAATTLAAELDAGRDVALLCQGDPFFYGSFIEIYARLARDYRVEIVPGVSSLTAGAAAAGFPLAARDGTMTVIPATLGEAELMRLIGVAETAVVIKIGRHFDKLCRVLDRLGLAHSTLYVEHATLPGERIMTLAEVEPAEVPYFSLALVRRGGPAR